MIHVILFTATWCRPCDALKPKFGELPKEHGGVVFSKMDIEKNADAARMYGVRSVPTMIVLQNDILVGTVVNPTTTAQMSEKIEETLEGNKR